MPSLNPQGIAEPVSVQAVFMRQGLGSSAKNTERNPAVFRESALHMLSEFARNDSHDDLVFSNELTNEQRKTLHLVIL